MRTPPYNLLLSQGLTPDALALIAEDVSAVFGGLPGVLGPKAASRSFCERWQSLSRQSYRLKMMQRIYRLEAVRPVSGVSGKVRPATVADRDLLLRWTHSFTEEALGTVPESDDTARTVDGFLTRETRGILLWEDPHPVSMAGYGSPTPHGIRVSAVYTPPACRRRGYASACVAAVSQHLLESGYTFCFLFTNLSNPTSNHIYQDVGYVPVCDVDQYKCLPPGGR